MEDKWDFKRVNIITKFSHCVHQNKTNKIFYSDLLEYSLIIWVIRFYKGQKVHFQFSKSKKNKNKIIIKCYQWYLEIL